MKPYLRAAAEATGALVLLAVTALALPFLTWFLFQGATPAGSGGIGAVSFGCAEALVDIAPFMTAQLALVIAAFRHAVHPRAPRWHLLASLLLFLFLSMTGVLQLTSPVIASAIVVSIGVVQVAITIGAIVLAIRRPGTR